MFRWKTPLGADDALKHGAHNQKKHGNRGGAVMAGARVKFAKAKAAGGANNSDADNEFSKVRNAEIAQSLAATKADMQRRLNSAISEKTSNDAKRSSLEALHKKLLSDFNAAADAVSDSPFGTDERRLAIKRRKEIEAEIESVRIQRGDLMKQEQEQNDTVAYLTSRLKAYDAVKPGDRVPGWPSDAVAREAKALREKIAGRRDELKKEYQELNGRYESGTKLYADLTREMSRLDGVMTNTPKQDRTKPEYLNAEKRFDELRSNRTQLENELNSIKAQRDGLAANARQEFLDEIKASIRKADPNPNNQTVTFSGFDAGNEQTMQDQMKVLRETLSSRLEMARSINTKAGGDSNEARGDYTPGTGNIKMYTGSFKSDQQLRDTFTHEYGHSLEEVPGVYRHSLAFRERRTIGEESAQLPNYPDDVRGYQDKFKDIYAGRDYGPGNFTEIISVGLQRMTSNPGGFADEDPDYFDFVYSIMRGDF
jgi:hypothetical protein